MSKRRTHNRTAVLACLSRISQNIQIRWLAQIYFEGKPALHEANQPSTESGGGE